MLRVFRLIMRCTLICLCMYAYAHFRIASAYEHVCIHSVIIYMYVPAHSIACNVCRHLGYGRHVVYKLPGILVCMMQARYPCLYVSYTCLSICASLSRSVCFMFAYAHACAYAYLCVYMSMCAGIVLHCLVYYRLVLCCIIVL